MNSEDIAKVCHAANRAYRDALGQEPGCEWKDYPQDMKRGAIEGVDFVKSNLDVTEEQLAEG